MPVVAVGPSTGTTSAESCETASHKELYASVPRSGMSVNYLFFLG